MSASRTPDPARSYALIIGASDYEKNTGYVSVPTAAENAKTIGALIRSEKMWGLPSRNVRVLNGRVTVREAAAAIEETASRADVDGLFVYMCAHGRIFRDEHVPDHNLHFAFADSHRDWSYTHLPFLTVRRMLTRRLRSTATVLIIDSCYSAGAFLGSEAVPVPSVPGVCTLIATKRLEEARAEVPGSPYTAFSGALIDIINNGISGPAQFLTADVIFEDLLRRLKADHAEPDMRANGPTVFLCRNQAYLRVESGLPVDKLIAALDNPHKSVDPALYATAVEDAYVANPPIAVKIVNEFGSKRTGAEIVELAKALQSRGVVGLSGYAEALISCVYAGRPAAEIVQLLHWHDREKIKADQVLTELLKQPNRVTADVSAGLRAMECGDCALISNQFDDRIPVVWPKDRVDGLVCELY
jgi:hypothetical protein